MTAVVIGTQLTGTLWIMVSTLRGDGHSVKLNKILATWSTVHKQTSGAKSESGFPDNSWGQAKADEFLATEKRKMNVGQMERMSLNKTSGDHMFISV